MDEGWINQDTLFGKIQQVIQQREMPVAASDPVSGAILIEDKQLTRIKPAQ